MEKLRKHLAILPDCSGCMRYLVFQNDACTLSPVVAISIKMAIRKTSIFGYVYLFPDTVVYTFSEAAFGELDYSINTMPQDLSNLQYFFIVVAALTHSGAQLNMSQSDSISNWMVNLLFLTELSSNKLKSPQY